MVKKIKWSQEELDKLNALRDNMKGTRMVPEVLTNFLDGGYTPFCENV